MKFALKDIIVVGISTVIISGASVTLYKDFTARVEGGERKKIGTILYKKRVPSGSIPVRLSGKTSAVRIRSTTMIQSEPTKTPSPSLSLKTVRR